jgi:hypothetical protein
MVELLEHSLLSRKSADSFVIEAEPTDNISAQNSTTQQYAESAITRQERCQSATSGNRFPSGGEGGSSMTLEDIRGSHSWPQQTWLRGEDDTYLLTRAG